MAHVLEGSFRGRPVVRIRVPSAGRARTIAIGVCIASLLAGLVALQLNAQASTRHGFWERFEERTTIAAGFISSYLQGPGAGALAGSDLNRSPVGREYLSRIGPIQGTRAVIVEGTDVLAASSGPVTTLDRVDPRQAAALVGGNRSGTYSHGSTDRFFVARSIAGTPFTLVMSAPVDHILSPLQSNWAQWLILLALAVISGVTVGLLKRLFTSRAALQDLNDRLEARVEERTAELAASNAELESFAYSVSHDLRAPLRAMDGFSKIVMDEYSDQLPEEGHRFLGMVRDNATKMQALIDDLLRFSRLGRQRLALHPVDCQTVVARVVQELVPVIHEQGARVAVGELPMAMGDQSLLWQVFSNLVGNALKFSRDVDDPVVEIGGEILDDSRVRYWVRDNGVGFDMAYADKLFGVFQRLHRSEDYEGSGVGLATVHRIVSRHGGRIWAESAPDAGATFYFELEGAVDG